VASPKPSIGLAPASVDGAGVVAVEVQLAGPVGVAGNPQVHGIAKVRAELEAVVAVDLGHVIDKLNLPLALVSGQLHWLTPKPYPSLSSPTPASWMSKAGMPEV
jgi:hypothetical protein